MATNNVLFFVVFSLVGLNCLIMSYYVFPLYLFLFRFRAILFLFNETCVWKKLCINFVDPNIMFIFAATFFDMVDLIVSNKNDQKLPFDPRCCE